MSDKNKTESSWTSTIKCHYCKKITPINTLFTPHGSSNIYSNCSKCGNKYEIVPIRETKNE